ncbi:DUF4834 family protein [Chitinophaga lutea]
MLRFVITLIVGWILYKLIFDFIIPVYRTTKVVRRQVRDMQDAMQQQFRQQQQAQQNAQQQEQVQAQARQHAEAARKRDDGDYIEFEEVK